MNIEKFIKNYEFNVKSLAHKPYMQVITSDRVREMFKTFAQQKDNMPTTDDALRESIKNVKADTDYWDGYGVGFMKCFKWFKSQIKP